MSGHFYDGSGMLIQDTGWKTLNSEKKTWRIFALFLKLKWFEAVQKMFGLRKRCFERLWGQRKGSQSGEKKFFSRETSLVSIKKSTDCEN